MAWQIFAYRDFKISGTPNSISGKDILSLYFDIHNVDSWAMFGILIAYVVFFRFVQYFLMACQTGVIKIPKPAWITRLLHREVRKETVTQTKSDVEMQSVGPASA